MLSPGNYTENQRNLIGWFRRLETKRALTFHGKSKPRIGVLYIFFFCFAGGLLRSPMYGKPSSTSIDHTYHFTFAPNEKIESIEIGAGYWIDSVQLNTDLKSTPRAGGGGGKRTKIKVRCVIDRFNNKVTFTLTGKNFHVSSFFFFQLVSLVRFILSIKNAEV